MRCRFTATYYDGLREREFRCENDAIENSYCIFHHPDYWREDSNEVIKRFREKVREKLQSDEDLVFVGYNLPDFNFADITGSSEINVRVCFDRCKFQNADFSGVVFKKEVSFRNAEFKEGIFVETKFEKDVHFNYAKFDYAYFIVAEFNGRCRLS